MAPKQAVTIRDVARQAGVSPGTVSRAINNSPLVNEATRQRIMQVIAELQYTPNLIARQLSTGKTLAVAVVVPFFTHPSVAERLSGAVSLLADSQYDLVIHNIETPEQRAAGFVHVLRPDRVDGALIISLPIFDREIPQLTDAAVPIVFIDTDHPTLSLHHRLVVDDIAGGQQATEHLVSLGHRRIAFVGDQVDNPFHFTSSHERYYGYCRALDQADIAIRPEYQVEGEHGRAEARMLARRILVLPERPTAIFAASDLQAIGVIEAAREISLRIPEDLSVIGYDDIEMAEIVELTTIHQPLFESGRRGVELLMQTMQKPQTPPVYESLPTELVVRHTTAPPSS